MYEGIPHGYLLFSSEGMPISRAEDITVVMYRSFLHLWLSDAEVASSTDMGLFKIDTVEVARGGYVRVKERPQASPKDKTEVTGVGYEPWHYRYVGVAAAQEIMAQGICLEEYVGQ